MIAYFSTESLMVLWLKADAPTPEMEALAPQAQVVLAIQLIVKSTQRSIWLALYRWLMRVVTPEAVNFSSAMHPNRISMVNTQFLATLVT